MGEAEAAGVYERFERQLLRRAAERPAREPWREGDRRDMIHVLRSLLGIRDEWIPDLSAEPVREWRHKGFRVQLLRFRSWDRVYGTAHLYLPDETSPAYGGRLPLVLLCCGHGLGGKWNRVYRYAAASLARQGACVLVPDVIGQGAREWMGHRHVVTPFACGLSVQGLIAMEALAWVRWAVADARFDRSRLAAIGNSGGGLLTCLLAALGDDLKTIASSGYPSSFEFIARKEKAHCHCNILPGFVGELEMWQLYGLFAPKPLYLFHGQLDALFPTDLFWQCARNVRSVYAHLQATSMLETELFQESGHPWDRPKVERMGQFLSRHLDLRDHLKQEEHSEQVEADRFEPPIPVDAIDTDALAVQLSGVHVRQGMGLWDVFPQHIPSLSDDARGPRGEHRQIWAQFNAFCTSKQGGI